MIDQAFVTVVIGAIFGGLTTLIPALLIAWQAYRRATAKLKTEIDAARTENEKKILAARGEFKREADESDRQSKMIGAIIDQAAGVKELAESVRQIALSIKENTLATNSLKEAVDSSGRQTEKLNADVNDFAGNLGRVIRTMEDTQKEIQKTGLEIETTSQATQDNSQVLAGSIVEQLIALTKISNDTLAIVTDIDERLKRLEAIPAPLPSVAVQAALTSPITAEGPPIVTPTTGERIENV